MNILEISNVVEQTMVLLEESGIMLEDDLSAEQLIDQEQEQFYVAFEVLKYLKKHYHITPKLENEMTKLDYCTVEGE